MGPPAISRRRSGEGGLPRGVAAEDVAIGSANGRGREPPLRRARHGERAARAEEVRGSHRRGRRRRRRRLNGRRRRGRHGLDGVRGPARRSSRSVRLAADRSTRAAGVGVGAVSGVGGGGVGAVSGGGSVTSISTGGASIGRSAARSRMGMRRSAAAITTCETPEQIPSWRRYDGRVWWGPRSRAVNPIPQRLCSCATGAALSASGCRREMRADRCWSRSRRRHRRRPSRDGFASRA